MGFLDDVAVGVGGGVCFIFVVVVLSVVCFIAVEGNVDVAVGGVCFIVVVVVLSVVCFIVVEGDVDFVVMILGVVRAKIKEITNQ